MDPKNIHVISFHFFFSGHMSLENSSTGEKKTGEDKWKAKILFKTDTITRLQKLTYLYT